MHRKLKKLQHGTKTLWKGAKSRVRVFVDMQNFARHVHCVHGIPVTSAFWAVHKKGDKNKSGYMMPTFSGAKSGQNWYVTPVFSGVLRKGDKIRNGYITPTFYGHRNGRKGYITPAFLGVPKKGDKNGPHLAGGKRPVGAVLEGGPSQNKFASLRTALMAPM